MRRIIETIAISFLMSSAFQAVNIALDNKRKAKARQAILNRMRSERKMFYITAE